jgi:exosome complex exonuclease DIS3/RRP44
MSYRLGIEGLVTFKRETKFDPDEYTITIPAHDGTEVTVAVFDKVTVSISVEKDKNTQRGRVRMTLVEPVDARDL